MTSNEYTAKLRRLQWLRDIAKEYVKNLDIIENERKYIRVFDIQFAARGDTELMHINPDYFPIEGVEQSLKTGLELVISEIKTLKEELQCLTVTLD